MEQHAQLDAPRTGRSGAMEFDTVKTGCLGVLSATTESFDDAVDFIRFKCVWDGVGCLGLKDVEVAFGGNGTGADGLAAVEQ